MKHNLNALSKGDPYETYPEMITLTQAELDQRIAAAVAAEREACAKIAISASVRHGLTSAEIRTGDQVAQHIAAAIRARGEGGNHG